MTLVRLQNVVRPALLAGTAILVPASASIAAQLPAPAAHTAPVKAPEAAAQRPAEGDTASRNVVARSRMLECGHQWNSLKKNGAASGTWKDFSRGCLAQR